MDRLLVLFQLLETREVLLSSRRSPSTHNVRDTPSLRLPLEETSPQESELKSRLGNLRQLLMHPIRTYKGIVSSTAKSGYRSDLRAEAVSRASALRQAQRPKKDLPEKKLRGVKAKKAAAEKDE